MRTGLLVEECDREWEEFADDAIIQENKKSTKVEWQKPSEGVLLGE